VAEEEKPKRRRRTRNDRSAGAKVALRARRQLGEITGLEPQAVTSLERQDDGTWRVTVELLELSRLPETDDLLGAYEVELDESGDLLGYRRVRRYTRSQTNEVGAPGGQ